MSTLYFAVARLVKVIAADIARHSEKGSVIRVDLY
jgi:hypothetical protein